MPVHGPGTNDTVTTKPVVTQPNSTNPKPIEPNNTTPRPDPPKPTEPNNTTPRPDVPSTTTPQPITIHPVPTTALPVVATPEPTSPPPAPQSESREAPTPTPPPVAVTPPPGPPMTVSSVPTTAWASTQPTPSPSEAITSVLISATTPTPTAEPSTIPAVIEVTTQAPPTISPPPSAAKEASPAINRGASSSSGPDENTIIFVVAGVVICVGIGFVVALLFVHRRRRSRKPAVRMTPVVADAHHGSPSGVYELAATPCEMVPDREPTVFGTDHILRSIRIPFDQLQIGAFMSRGAFGEVLHASYRGEAVVVKRLVQDRRLDADEAYVFAQEIKLMTTLQHPRIVRLLGAAWQSPATLCAVAEFMEGGDLRSWLKKRHAQGQPIGFNRHKLKIALHVVEALAYLHSLQPKIIHRDLKSKNVVLSASGDAKLTDFGVSRERCETTMTSEVGSALWMAPEIIYGGHYDERADIFALGVLLSELDTQMLPYQFGSQSLSQVAVLNLVQEGKLMVSFTAAASDDVVTRAARACVALDPRDRPSAESLRALLHRCVWGR